MDQNYYKKLELQNEYDRVYDHRMHLPEKMNVPSKPLEEGSVPVNPENKSELKSSFRPKMLNNVDELGGVL